MLGADEATRRSTSSESATLVPPGATLTQFALKWILSFEAVSCVIPGARRPSQVEDNARAANLSPLSPETLAAVQEIYDDCVRPLVHQRW